MAAIVTVTFVDGYTLSAAQLNDIQTNIKAVVDGDIENSNIKALAAIVESKLLFSDVGHKHGGDADGSGVDLSNSFGIAPAAGLPPAVLNSDQGALLFKNGSKVVAAGASELITFAGDAFSQTPLVKLYPDTLSNVIYGVIGGGGGHVSVRIPTGSVSGVSDTNFSIVNNSSISRTFTWKAIGTGS